MTDDSVRRNATMIGSAIVRRPAKLAGNSAACSGVTRVSAGFHRALGQCGSSSGVSMHCPSFHVAFIGLVRRARGGNAKAALTACFAATPYFFYLAASPFDDTKLTTVHWPAPAYLPLLVFVPGVLIRFVQARPTWC